MARVFGTHEDSEMPTGLQRRAGGTYWLRRRVPLDLVEAFGRNEVVRSLRTKDPKEAKRRLAAAMHELELEFDGKRHSLLTAETVVDRPLDHISPTVIALTDLDGLRSRQLAHAAAGTLRTFRQQCHDALALLQAMLEGDVPADDDLRVIEGKRNGLRAFLSGEGATALSIKRRPLIPDGEAQNLSRQITSINWSELVRRWAAERKPRPKTLQAHQSVADQFQALVSAEPVETITRKKVIQFKDKLVEQGVTSANLRTKMSRLKTLINYGYDNDLVGVRAAEGIRLPIEKGPTRRPFDGPSLRALFEGPVHAEGYRPPQGRGEAAYWLPLIGLFTGARLEEIAHLTIDDVRPLPVGRFKQVDEWHFRFCWDEASNRQLKNAASERDVPVHPELQRLGLIEYVEELRRAGKTQLFPLLTQHRSGKRAHKWGQWFHSYLRSECAVTDRLIVFHSFRHTFKDAARDSAVPEGIQRQIMGHEGRDVADGYGGGFSREAVVKAMKQIEVPGLPRLKPEPPQSADRAPVHCRQRHRRSNRGSQRRWEEMLATAVAAEAEANRAMNAERSEFRVILDRLCPLLPAASDCKPPER
jgi:integrase